MNIEFNEHYDVVVVGAGHAGVEAALASSRMGLKTLILTLNLESIAFLACNPAIGGTAKGHLVREIDALGGQMGISSDHTLIQLRMLNSAKGVAVQSLRAQADKNKYHTYMKKVLEEQENLVIQQGEAKEVLVENGKVVGVETLEGCKYFCDAIVLCTGVYLTSDIIMGSFRKNSGPSGFGPANYLTKNLIDLGFEIRRFKTGTPARIDKRSIDFSKFEIQDGEDGIQPFSFMTDKLEYEKNPCYLGYTNAKTHKIILDNLQKAPMYSGDIKGIGPRYCPSIETKIVRFADKERHQIFIEPEGLDTNEMYIQGMSTSFPPDIQTEMYRSIEGLENARIMRFAYAIEYDCINPLDLYATLQFKKINGLYTAGQINGSSGYEEAAAQGLVAGINAANYCMGKKPLVLTRSNSYIGVLIDDLVTKGTEEPYRMMTSRAEYRLYLRQDNADLRLTEIGKEIGLVTEERYKKFLKRKEDLKKINELLQKRMSAKEINEKLFAGENKTNAGMSLKELICKNLVDIMEIKEKLEEFKEFEERELVTVQTEIKYEGYLAKQDEQIKKQEKQESKLLPEDIDYLNIKGLRLEARQKLDKIRPLNLGQASRISGVSPADIAVLIVYLQTNKG